MELIVLSYKVYLRIGPYNGGLVQKRIESNKVWQCHREVVAGFCLSQSVLGLSPDGPSLGGLWTGDETSAPSFSGVFAVRFSGPWENSAEFVTIFPPGTKPAGHFWSSSDPRPEPCCSPFPALGSYWESMTSSSSGITHFYSSFKTKNWLFLYFKVCGALHHFCPS